MRRALLVLAAVLLVAAGLVVASVALSGEVDSEIDQLDVTEAAMAARHHPAGSTCVRYPTEKPELAALRETADRLRALGLAVDDWADLFAHAFTLEQRREQALHGRSVAEEYLAELEQATASRPLTRFAVSVHRARLLAKLEQLTSVRDLATAGEAAFAKLSPAQQQGFLALLTERPAHFQLGAFVKLLQDARDQEEEKRLEAEAAKEAPMEEPPPPLPCPPLPHRARITAAERDAALSGEREVLTQARVVPAFTEGAFEGFKLFGLRRGTRVAEVGFCNGDRIVSINGRELSSAAAVAEAVTEWGQAKQLEFKLVRDGVAGTLTLDVTDSK